MRNAARRILASAQGGRGVVGTVATAAVDICVPSHVPSHTHAFKIIFHDITHSSARLHTCSHHFCFAEINPPLALSRPFFVYVFPPAGKDKERFTLCVAVIADGGKVPCASFSRARRSSRRPRREGQAGSAAEGLHHGRDPLREPHQVWAPGGGHVFWRGEQLV